MENEYSFEKDLKFIERELIARQINGKYIKFNKDINAVAILNMTKYEYLDYWSKQYEDNIEKMEKIIEICNDKFENNLVSREEMIELVLNSKDNTKDKPEALRLLGYKI